MGVQLPTSRGFTAADSALTDVNHVKSCPDNPCADPGRSKTHDAEKHRNARNKMLKLA